MKYVYSFEGINGSREIYRTNNRENAEGWFEYLNSEGRNPKWLRHGHLFADFVKESSVGYYPVDRAKSIILLNSAKNWRLMLLNGWTKKHCIENARKALNNAKYYRKIDCVCPLKAY